MSTDLKIIKHFLKNDEVLVQSNNATVEGFGVKGKAFRNNIEKINKLDLPFTICETDSEDKPGARVFYVQEENKALLEKLKQRLGVGLENSIINPERVTDHFIYDDAHSTDENSVLSTVLVALDQNLKIDLTYKSYKSQDKTYENLVPILIKQNRYRRYYLIAAKRESDSIGLKDVVTLGLDRISDIRIHFQNGNTSLNDSTIKAVKTFFDDLVGTHVPNLSFYQGNFPTNPPAIKIQATYLQAQYLASAPLHKSQEPKCIKDIKKGEDVEFTFKVWPNIEFIQSLITNMILNNDTAEYSHPERAAIKVVDTPWLEHWVNAQATRVLRDHLPDGDTLKEELTKRIEEQVKDNEWRSKFEYTGVMECLEDRKR